MQLQTLPGPCPASTLCCAQRTRHCPCRRLPLSLPARARSSAARLCHRSHLWRPPSGAGTSPPRPRAAKRSSYHAPLQTGRSTDRGVCCGWCAVLHATLVWPVVRGLGPPAPLHLQRRPFGPYATSCMPRAGSRRWLAAQLSVCHAARGCRPASAAKKPVSQGQIHAATLELPIRNEPVQAEAPKKLPSYHASTLEFNPNSSNKAAKPQGVAISSKPQVIIRPAAQAPNPPSRCARPCHTRGCMHVCLHTQWARAGTCTWAAPSLTPRPLALCSLSVQPEVERPLAVGKGQLAMDYGWGDKGLKVRLRQMLLCHGCVPLSANPPMPLPPAGRRPCASPPSTLPPPSGSAAAGSSSQAGAAAPQAPPGLLPCA